MMTMPHAVLWDMDGTLVDTEPYWMQTETEIAAARGVAWTREDALALVGNDLIVSGQYLKDRIGMPESPAEIVEMLLDGVVEHVRREVPWRPGARELLADLVEQRVPCALVTMSYQRFVDPILALLPPGTFDVVVTGDQVDNGKPHPEPYLKAVAGLGFEPWQCLAIEDSNTGATSAESAGCTVLVVENHVQVEAGPRRIHHPSLVGLTSRTLPALFAG
jgi:HAD superfamily hydrolase (TIGR01509 family)